MRFFVCSRKGAGIQRSGFDKNWRDSGKLTKHDPGSIPGPSSRPSHLDIPRPIWLWISQCAAGLVLANLVVPGALRSASRICSTVSLRSEVMN